MALTPNVVASTPIASVWGNEIRDRSLQNFASAAERTSQWPTPPEGAQTYLRDSDTLQIYNGTSWVCISPISATVATLQSTASGTYTNLTTVGPAVSILTGTKALVTLASNMASGTALGTSFAAFVVSGATSVAANDAYSIALVSAAASAGGNIGATYQIAGLTAGVNTFTMVYRATGGTSTFLNRNITVVGIP